jgi:serine protease
MRPRTLVLKWAIRSGTAVTATALAGLAGLAWAQGPVSASVNPRSPAVGHSYRHGVLPTISRHRAMASWAAAHPGAKVHKQNPLNLSYGGGIHGHAVISGKEKVYLVFWGSQWGAQSVNGGGDVTLAGDPSGEAPVLQELFKGLGTGGETWSGVMTQYCDGVKYKAKSCPASAAHVGYPTGGALAGVWVDEHAPAPGLATGNQLGNEAVAAAHHFGLLTTKANADAQYVILSPTQTHPDGFNTPNGEFCAWHDDTADPNLPSGPVSAKLDIAFTNMPYVTDLGTDCGENFVNLGARGLTDGVSIVEGHEYAETITDQLPAFGWTNAMTGAEGADLCAWNTPHSVGGTNDLKLPTGRFAMQSFWANDDKGGRCEFVHPVVG